jgi:hypothetical protein
MEENSLKLHGKGQISGCFDLRWSRLRRGSRAAQHDKFETFWQTDMRFSAMNWPILQASRLFVSGC